MVVIKTKASKIARSTTRLEVEAEGSKMLAGEAEVAKLRLRRGNYELMQKLFT